MGAASGYFILLCALSLGVEVYGFGTTYPAMNVSPIAATTDASMDHAQSHGKDVGATPASEPSHTTIAHLVKATTQPETHAVLTLPAHHLTSKSTDDITTPAPKHKTTAKQQVLTQRKEPETESELRATATLLTLPAHPLTSKSTDDITTPAPKHKTTAKQQVLTQRKEPETESELRVTDELSKPKIYYQDVHYKTLEISCFSEHGRLPITYSIIKNKTEVLKSLTVHSREPADFTIEMKPGKSAEHVCKAESEGQTKFSEPLLEIKIPEEEETPTHSDADKEEDLSEPKHLITLSHILTSVDRSVQHRNTILMSVCGPVILLVLGMFIIVVHFHQRRDNCDKL